MEDNIKTDNISNEKELANRQEYPLLYSLKYVLDFYFGEISVETILNMSAVNTAGFTSEIAIDVIEEVGLNSAYKDIDAKDIPSHFFPCIVIDKEDKPFVLLKKDKDIYLWDPIKHKEVQESKAFLKNFQKAILVFRNPNKEEILDKKERKTGFGHL